jgi:hypothetical protein
MKLQKLCFKKLYLICALMLTIAQQNLKSAVEDTSSGDVANQKKVVVTSTDRPTMAPLFLKIAGPAGKVVMHGDDNWLLDTTGNLFYCNKNNLNSTNQWQPVSLPKPDKKKKNNAAPVNSYGDITVDDAGVLWFLGVIYNKKGGGYSLYKGTVQKDKKTEKRTISWKSEDGNMVKIAAGTLGKHTLSQNNSHIWGIDAKGQLSCRKKTTTAATKLATVVTIVPIKQEKWVDMESDSDKKKIVLADIAADVDDNVTVIDNNKKLYTISRGNNAVEKIVEKGLGLNVDLNEQKIDVDVLSLVTPKIFVGTDFALYKLSVGSDMTGKGTSVMAQKMPISTPAVSAAVNKDGDMILVGQDGSLYYGPGALAKNAPAQTMILRKPLYNKQGPVQKQLGGPAPQMPKLGMPQQSPEESGTMLQLNSNNNTQQNDQDQAPSAPLGETTETTVDVDDGSSAGAVSAE